MFPAGAELHSWRAGVDSCCVSLTTGEGRGGLSRTQREWWRAASRVRLTVQCLVVQIQTPYCALSGNASSTDFEARPREYVA
jgi:hypothetical protein